MKTGGAKNRFVDVHSDEPAKAGYIRAAPLTAARSGSSRNLQQPGAQQPLRRKRPASITGIQPVELARYVAKHLVDQDADRE